MNQWWIPNIALGKSHDINIGGLETKPMRRQVPFSLVMLSVSLCMLGKIVLNVFITWNFWAKVNPFI